MMLAKQGSLKDLKDKNFIFEPKFDGTRVLIHKEGKKIRLINRRNNNITHRYPELEELWRNIKDDSIIDGELVILGKKHLPDFNLLQKRDLLEDKFRINLLSKSHPATIFVFDILKLKGKNLTNLSLLERKKFLAREIKKSSKISLTPYTRDGEKLWKKIKKLRMEGVMAKKINSKYEGRRTSAWVKIKNTKSLDAIVIGYTKEKRAISALALAAYHNKKLIYIGRVGAGLSEGVIKELLRKLKLSKPEINIKTAKKINYVKPNVIVEVKYLEITKDFSLRAPAFLRIRYDKPLKECII